MAFHVHRRRTLISLVSLVSQRKERTIVICHPHREDALVEMTGCIMMMGLLVVKERAFQPYFNGDVSVELTLSNSHSDSVMGPQC